MTIIKKAVQAKLEERRATEYLKKCKAATAEALAAIADEAEATGEAPQTVLNHYLGKPPTKGDARRSQTEGEQALALLRKTTSVKPTANSTAKPAATASPLAAAPTDHLVLCVRRGWLSGPDLDGARAELARRGVEILKHGFSHSCKNTQ